MVGFPAGGASDGVARLLADRLSVTYAPSVIVDNRSGASGRIAAVVVKNSEAEGNVLLLTPASTMVLYPHVYSPLAYDPIKDFAPVTPVCTAQFALSVGPAVSVRVKTVEDFIRWCRANPRRAMFGSPGAGTMAHFAGMMFARAAKLDLTHVPYKGGARLIQDVMGGHIACGFNAISSDDAGMLRILATTGATRSPYLPHVPTLKEAGYREVEVQEYFAFFVPVRTPSARILLLYAAILDALDTVKVKDGLAELSLLPASMTPESFASTIRADIVRWGNIVRASGFTAEG